MMKNNNQTAVKRIAKCSMRSNRARNAFAVLAIILTTFMFTTVFGIGFSLAKNLNIMLLRQQGTKASIYLANPTKEQLKQVKMCGHLHAAGVQIHTGRAQSVSDSETMIALDYCDKADFEKNILPAISDIKGDYPTEDGEIMLSKDALTALNIHKPSLGMDVRLLIDGVEKSFRLSGWFTDYGFAVGGFQGFVSKAYTDSLGLTTETDGILSISAKSGQQANLLDELEKNVELKDGQTIESSYDVQDENSSNTVVVVVAIGLICLIIVFSGYLLIYNVMYISVTKDIRFYGMLKTIGTSPKQIKKIVKMQALRLSVVGIPVGILLGTLTSFAIVPYALEMFGSGGNHAMPTDICFNPFIYIGTILFGIFTVMFSCRKPAKLAAKVSPVEALKYNGQNPAKIKPKKSTKGGRIFKMAWRNVFREKKRAILVFASLFMGTMAFLTTNAFIGSLKLENYVDFYLPDDFTIYTNSGDEGNSSQEEKAYVDAAKKLAEDISKIQGITHVSVNRSVDAEIKFEEEVFRPFIENRSSKEAAVKEMIDYYKENPYSAPVIGVSADMMERYNERARRKIDIERFEKGEVCFVGYVNTQEQSDEVIGKHITLTDKDSKKTVTLEIGTCPVNNDDYGINVGYYWYMAGAPSYVLVSQNVIDRLSDNPSVDNIIVDCKPKAETYVKSRIQVLTQTNPSVLQTDIKSEMSEDFQSSMTSMNILTAGISLILILIGVLNFVNVMLTGVFTRRKELAVMESVGMTKKQIQKMLMFEGLYYGAITIMLILTIGNVLVYATAKLAQRVADYAVFHYPFGMMFMIVAVILLICIMVPAAVYRTLSKESVTERLHGME